MARTSNRFIDNATGETYDWPINHSSEDPTGKKRNITASAPTGFGGLNRQQGADDPMTLTWKGTILTRAQLVAMNHWYALCDSRTIDIIDFHGNHYEVMIDDFAPTRRGVVFNPRDPVNAPNVVWDYTIQMTVISIKAGDFAELTP